MPHASSERMGTLATPKIVHDVPAMEERGWNVMNKPGERNQSQIIICYISIELR